MVSLKLNYQIVCQSFFDPESSSLACFLLCNTIKLTYDGLYASEDQLSYVKLSALFIMKHQDHGFVHFMKRNDSII